MVDSGRKELGNVAADYWTEKWKRKETNWHKDVVDVMLKKHVSFFCRECESPEGLSVFVPLCGKSLDLAWLCDQGMRVVGNDLSQIAAEDFFYENSIPFKQSQDGAFIVYEAIDRKITFLVGDVFECTPEVVGIFDCIWEVNSLVAINLKDRTKYAKTLAALTKPGGRMILSVYEYDQTLRSTFPFSLPPAMVTELFESDYTVTLKEQEDLKGKFFTKKFNLPWAFRNVHFMERK